MSFPPGGMGLTLTKELNGGCWVTKVLAGGVAHTNGIAVGHRVCGEVGFQARCRPGKVAFACYS